MLSAAITTAGCVAEHPKRALLAKTETASSNVISARFSKASLVGCWTWLQEDDEDDWVCFDEEGHYVVVVSYDRMGRDSVGTYNVTSDGQLVFKEEDEIIGAGTLKLYAASLLEFLYEERLAPTYLSL